MKNIESNLQRLNEINEINKCNEMFIVRYRINDIDIFEYIENKFTYKTDKFNSKFKTVYLRSRNSGFRQQV